ncbi:hypothetical protein BS50DRAFT_448629, partial [Corynespora cassiicola Philippines]
MAQYPTYLLAPNFTFKPRTGPLALGSLIADPFRPHRVLTAVDEDAVSRYPRIETVIESQKSIARESTHETGFSLWTEFLQIVGASAFNKRGSHAATEFSMSSLVTEYFVNDPGVKEIKARIAHPRVRAIMKPDGFAIRQPVYMVTGLKIAEGLFARRENSKSMGVGVGSGIPIPIPVGEVGVGADIMIANETMESDQWNTNEDIVLAYQLLKIELRGWRNKSLKVDEFRHKSAFLEKGISDSESGEEEDNDEI